MHPRLHPGAFTVIAILLLQACSGPARSVVPDLEPVVVVDTVRAPEPFDIAPYADEPATIDDSIVHDVPAILMRNSADAGQLHEADGFRVQVFSSLDLTEAASMEDAVKNFWENLVRTDPMAVEGMTVPTVYRLFRQPYYRIRVGDYLDRARAEKAARLLADRFQGAFVVPDRVSVRK